MESYFQAGKERMTGCARDGPWCHTGCNIAEEMNTWRAYLAAVTLNVEVAVQGHDADGLLLARRRHYGLRAHAAARSKLPAEQNQRTEISSEQQQVL